MGTFWESLRRLFGKSPAAGPPPPLRETLAEGAEQLDPNQVLAHFGGVLRTWGEQAFDIDQADASASQARFESWAAHLAEGAPSPAGRGGVGFRRSTRDWRNLKSFVSDHRGREKKFVSRNVKELKDALWTMVQRLSRTFAADKSSDAQVLDQLGHLKTAAARESLQELKRAVLASVEVIERAVAERQTRQQVELEEACNRLQATREELSQAKKELALDPLTKLYNRAAFDEKLRTVCALNNLSGKPATLLMIDADHFKDVNDQHGHQAGDEVLCALSRLLLKVFLRKHDFVARYGGEEFAVILPLNAPDIALNLAQRLLETVRAMRVPCQGKSIGVTVSIGVAELFVGEEAPAWLSRADQALLAAKEAGRDRCLAYQDITTTV